MTKPKKSLEDVIRDCDDIMEIGVDNVDIETFATAIRQWIREQMPEKLESIKYPPGSDGEKLMLLNKGYEQCLREVKKRLLGGA